MLKNKKIYYRVIGLLALLIISCQSAMKHPETKNLSELHLNKSSKKEVMGLFGLPNRRYIESKPEFKEIWIYYYKPERQRMIQNYPLFYTGGVMYFGHHYGKEKERKANASSLKFFFNESEALIDVSPMFKHNPITKEFEQ